MSVLTRALVVLAVGGVASADPAPLESATSSEVDLTRRPHGRVLDVLRQLPGVYAIVTAGGGQAEQLIARGFDARQGADVAVVVDGVPINAPGHAADHGYADLHFLIADAIATAALHEGPYAARAGDFATAGTLELRTVDHVDGAQVRLTSGSELTGPVVRRRLRRLFYRLSGLASPALERGEALLGAEVGIADGPYTNPQRMRRGSVLGKYRMPLARDGEVRAAVTLASGRWADSGVIPASDVTAGRLDEYGALDPTQGGTMGRASASAAVTTRDRRDATWHLGAYVMRTSDRLFANGTIFLRDGEHGDQVEQADERVAYGIDGYYARAIPFGELRLGVQARADDAHQELWHDERRERLGDCFGVANPCTRTASHVRDVAVYAEAPLRIAPRVEIATGVRLDQLTWDVDDLARPDALTATAARARFSPKLGVTVAATPSIDLLARAGGGFRTSDTRAIAASSAIRGIPRIWEGELGAIVHPAPAVRAAVTAYTAWQDAEVAWLAARGEAVSVPASRRVGLETRLRAELLPWLACDASLSIARRVGRAPTGAAALDRVFPELVASAGAEAYHGASYAGVRTVALSAQLANATIEHASDTVVTLVAGHRWHDLELTLSLENLMSAHARETQLVGDVRPARDAPIATDLLFSPGAPLTALVTLGYMPR